MTQLTLKLTVNQLFSDQAYYFFAIWEYHFSYNHWNQVTLKGHHEVAYMHRSLATPGILTTMPEGSSIPHNQWGGAKKRSENISEWIRRFKAGKDWWVGVELSCLPVCQHAWLFNLKADQTGEVPLPFLACFHQEARSEILLMLLL